MKNLVNNLVFKVALISVISIAIILVTIVGQGRMRRSSLILRDQMEELEADKKNSAAEDNKEENEDEEIGDSQEDSKDKPAQTDSSTNSKDDIYKGAIALGEINNTRWKDKRWLAIGDNITAKQSYQSKVKLSCSMGSVTSDANTGRVMGDMANNITTDKLKDIDIVTVFAGTSDYSLDTKLGTKSDDENSNTFYGNVHKVIKKLIASRKDITIVFFTPLKRGAYKTYPVYPNANNAGVKLDDYAKAIKEVCAEYNIPVLDLLNESGIDEKNIKNYTVDNLHLNQAGASKVTKVISDYFKKIK